ncbi:MAG: periplasmic copper-binding protein [Stygiobacter sp.]|nr:MAG: periplasmic copper-binding protein [Stygiobacter sp.]KAF0212787.1 MAG: periplasmic copper-binding [Ignavibacteria bacterium]
MKKIILLSVIFFAVTLTISARVIKVDINGSGNFTSISAALTAAVAGDTIKVLPGSYFEQVTINKNVVVMGSGYEATTITGNFNPTITMSSGKLMWFMISSLSGNGIHLNGGSVNNCIISACSRSGVYTNSGSSIVSNCVLIGNGSDGITASSPANISVTNCISRNNGGKGFYNPSWQGPISVSYSNGSLYSTSGNQGCIDQDPLFASTANLDFHISQGSPCWNKGNPSLFDPDGSQSDIGYFGGPDCPLYPVVKTVKIIPQADGSIKIEATGVANY